MSGGGGGHNVPHHHRAGQFGGPLYRQLGEIPLVHDEAAAPAPAPAAPAPAAVSAAAAVPAALPAEPTLHDFVLNLLRDPSAQQAFDLDPTGCLQAAGLHDITPGDVHDVIPLVTDLVPTGGLDSLHDVTSNLAVDGGAGLDGGWATVAGDNPLGALDGAGAVNGGLEDGITAGLRGAQETAFGAFGIGAGGEASTHGLHTGAVVTSPFGGPLENHLDLGVGDGAPAFGIEANYGDYHAIVGYDNGLTLDQSLVPGAPSVPDLAKGLADPTAAASALAGAVPALPAVPGLPALPDLGGGLPSLPALPVDVPHLPALPTLPTDQVGHVMDAGQSPLGAVGGVVDGAHTGQLPDVLGHLPAGLPHLPNLPIELPHLPVDLPHLPVDVPNLPNLPLGDASGHSPVGDVVDHTGLGGVINNSPVADVVHDVVPDLHLGL
jgi:hypothetical protein